MQARVKTAIYCTAFRSMYSFAVNYQFARLYCIVLCTVLMVLNFLGPSLANVKVFVRMPKVVCPMQNHVYALPNQIVQKSPKKRSSKSSEHLIKLIFLKQIQYGKVCLFYKAWVTHSKIFQFWSIWNLLLSSFKSFVLEILKSILLPGTWLPLYTGIIVIICASSL